VVSVQDRIGHKEHNSKTTSDDDCECELFMLCHIFSLTTTSTADAGTSHQSSTSSMLLATASSLQIKTSTQTPRIFPASDQTPRDNFDVIRNADEQRIASLERTENKFCLKFSPSNGSYFLNQWCRRHSW